MSTHNIRVESGTSKRLQTAGKYCDRDIIVTAYGDSTGGGGDSIARGYVYISAERVMNSSLEVWCNYVDVDSGEIVHFYNEVGSGSGMAIQNAVIGSIIVVKTRTYVMLEENTPNIIATCDDSTGQTNSVYCFKVVGTLSDPQKINFFE